MVEHDLDGSFMSRTVRARAMANIAKSVVQRLEPSKGALGFW